MCLTQQDSSALPDLTFHAAVRMQQRRVSETDIEKAISYGRLYHARDALIYVMGMCEIRKYARDPDVTERLNGLHVICARSGEVITCYRNPRFKHTSFELSPRHRRRSGTHRRDNSYERPDFCHGEAAPLP